MGTRTSRIIWGRENLPSLPAFDLQTSHSVVRLNTAKTFTLLYPDPCVSLNAGLPLEFQVLQYIIILTPMDFWEL